MVTAYSQREERKAKRKQMLCCTEGLRQAGLSLLILWVMPQARIRWVYGTRQAPNPDMVTAQIRDKNKRVGGPKPLQPYHTGQFILGKMLHLGVAGKEHCVKPLVYAHAPHSQLAWLPVATSTSLLHYINVKFWPHFTLVFHRYSKA